MIKVTDKILYCTSILKTMNLLGWQAIKKSFFSKAGGQWTFHRVKSYKPRPFLLQNQGLTALLDFVQHEIHILTGQTTTDKYHSPEIDIFFLGLEGAQHATSLLHHFLDLWASQPHFLFQLNFPFAVVLGNVQPLFFQARWHIVKAHISTHWVVHQYKSIRSAFDGTYQIS